MPRTLHLLILLIVPVQIVYSARDDPEFIDPNIIEMSPFVVYGGIIDTIDGFTEKEYHEDHPVVLGFREEFNNLLLGFHKKLLIDEHRHMTESLRVSQDFHANLNALSGSFGIRPTDLNERGFFTREKSITNRLVKDPFFIIEALIVWNGDRLERYKDRRPHSKYAMDIRYNMKEEKWERRVTTRWEVSFIHRNGRGSFFTYKEQGLNLDTNKGFHLIERGLPGDVPPDAFRKVKLTYPIFVNSFEPYDLQIERLQKTFISNLIQIYDPYSWMARRNERFRVRGKFQGNLKKELEDAKLPVTDRNWFDSVLSNFLTDVCTIKHLGVQEVYDHEMLMKIPIRKHILGIGFDLLNWNEGEDRSISYDPTRNGNVSVRFNNPSGARWIMIDAYRRYGDRVIDELRNELQTLVTQKKKMDGKDIIKKVLSEVTGTKADNYIKLAEKAQKQELEKYRYKLY